MRQASGIGEFVITLCWENDLGPVDIIWQGSNQHRVLLYSELDCNWA